MDTTNNFDERKIDMNELIEKGKQGKLTPADLDEVLEEMDYDLDRIDKLYETLEDNDIPLPEDLSSSELDEIKNDVERLAVSGDSMEKLLEQMYDTDIPFRRTDDEGVCTYCDFKMICGR